MSALIFSVVLLSGLQPAAAAVPPPGPEAVLAGAPATAPAADTVLVTGTATYLDGSPVIGCRVVVLHPGFEPMAETRCDDAGRYELRLAPDRYNGIAILDDGYGETTLEFWAWNVDVIRDLAIDALIDRAEVYDLSVWNSKGGSQSFFVSFRPMSLDRAAEGGGEAVVRDVPGIGEVAVVDLAPELTAGSVEVTVDGEPVPVELLQWYWHRIPGDDGDVYMPMALVQAARPGLDAGVHRVRVRIVDEVTGATGAAVTWVTSNEKGLGF